MARVLLSFFSVFLMLRNLKLVVPPLISIGSTGCSIFSTKEMARSYSWFYWTKTYQSKIRIPCYSILLFYLLLPQLMYLLRMRRTTIHIHPLLFLFIFRAQKRPLHPPAANLSWFCACCNVLFHPNVLRLTQRKKGARTVCLPLTKRERLQRRNPLLELIMAECRLRQPHCLQYLFRFLHFRDVYTP